MYAVCVNFELKPGKAKQFMPLMRANAQTSLNEEAGCLQFDVLTDPGRPDHVFLYEVYVDRGAFDDHLQGAHFKEFDAAVTDMIADKNIQTWPQVSQ